MIVFDDGDESPKKKKTVESAEKILKRELPHIINDVTMLVRKPFRFIWDESVGTASTDCFAEIRVAPRPFLEGEREVGYGTVYHETGHICFSPYGMALMKEANKRGGEFLQSLVNIIIDRKDDMLTAKEAPGFADTLRRRLLVIRTLSRREKYAHLLKGFSLAQQSQVLRNFKPADTYEDFFLAAKCGKSPRLKATRKAMQYVKLKDLAEATPDKLLWIAEKVREILAESLKNDEAKKKQSKKKRQKKSNDDDEQPKNDVKQKQQKAESEFVELFKKVEKSVNGKNIDQSIRNAMQAAVKQHLGTLRVSGTRELLRRLATMGMVHPGPISVGTVNRVPVREVKSSPRYVIEYEHIRREVEHLISPMVKALRNISTPSEFELYGQDEGELDFNEVARIATGLSGYRMETVVERDIDADIHLAIDNSGSMAKEKIKEAKKMGVVFSEAVSAMHPNCIGRIWSFNSDVICDYGPISSNSGFITAAGSAGNSDTHMLEMVGKMLLKSQKKRKILFVLCDDGPDSIERVQKLTQELTARGIIIVHLLVGVHGSPDIYPIELLYSSIEECLEEFGTLLQTIISHLK